MTIELPQSAVYFGLLFIGALPILSAWWTARTLRATMNIQMFEAMKEAYDHANSMGLQTANITAEAAKAMMEGMRTSSHIIEQVGGLALQYNPKDTLDRILAIQYEQTARRATNGRFVPRPAAAPVPAGSDESRRAPPGVKLPEDM